MSYKSAILNHAPDYWDVYGGEENELSASSTEFQKIANEVKNALGTSSKRIQSIKRIQNVFDLGQVLIREQLLLVANPISTYYRVSIDYCIFDINKWVLSDKRMM